MKRIYLLFILLCLALLSQGQNSKQTYSKENFSKCLCTVDRYNAQKWQGGKIDPRTLEQVFESDIVVLTISWEYKKMEVGRDKWMNIDTSKEAQITEGGIVQNIPVLNHPEIASFDILLDEKQAFKTLVFYKK